MAEAPAQQNLAGYLTVGEAAAFLGISPWTLRNWDADGRLKPLRHPINGYRMYRREDLAALLRPEALGGRPSGRPTPVDWTDAAESGHFVQFYESDAFLVGRVSRFLGAALGAGDGAVLVATPEHRRAVRRKLRAQGLNLAAARARDQFVALDAAATLDALLVDGVPDAGRFREVIVPVLERVAASRPRVKVFGEMVALLWADGRRDAAVRLEELWNDLRRTHAFSLCCGYPMRDFGGDGEERAFECVCACHGRVLPAESYAGLSDDGERLQTVARLQRKARALEAEVARRKEVEARLRDADRRKDEFLAMLAHELRNPLAPIRNGLEVMRRAGDNRAAVDRARDMIERQVGQMVRLVDDLLDISRINRGKTELKKQRVSLAEVVAAAVETSRPLVEAARHELTVTLPPEEVELDADPTRLAQVLSNLLNNAARYTEPGGRIRLSACRDGDHVRVSVRDSGIGIAAEALPHVFDLFVQADRSDSRAQGGLGVGLTLVRTFVGMHGGTVEARSDGPGKGSEFVVSLPLAAARSSPSAGECGPTPAPPPRRVLVVDDNPDAAQSLAMLLRLHGQEVRTARDGRQALAAAHEFRPEVAFLDIELPGMSGHELARRLRREPGGRDMLLVALTGWAQEEDRKRSRQAGFDEHLTKPADPDVLQRLLAERRV